MQGQERVGYGLDPSCIYPLPCVPSIERAWA